MLIRWSACVLESRASGHSYLIHTLQRSVLRVLKALTEPFAFIVTIWHYALKETSDEGMSL